MVRPTNPTPMSVQEKILAINPSIHFKYAAQRLISLEQWFRPKEPLKVSLYSVAEAGFFSAQCGVYFNS